MENIKSRKVKVFLNLINYCIGFSLQRIGLVEREIFRFSFKTF